MRVAGKLSLTLHTLPNTIPPLLQWFFRMWSRPRSKRNYTWAQLLRRVFAIEVFCCPHCGSPRRLVAFLTEPEVIDRILEHLGIKA